MKYKMSYPAVFAQMMIALSAVSFGISAQAQEGYEGGRGLITLEGPSGLFINPTSGTLPEGSATAQYCIFLPNNETDVVGHGLMAAYAVSDELEVGASGNYVDLRNAGDELVAGGPFVRYRLVKDSAGMPEVSVGAYSQFIGDEERERYSLFGAAFKRIVLDEAGTVRSLGLHLGVRNAWAGSDNGADDELAVYGGAELQLPARLYAVGEISSEHDNANEIPYSFGFQWRAAGIAMSLAGIQNGTTDDPSFYYGIGYATSF